MRSAISLGFPMSQIQHPTPHRLQFSRPSVPLNPNSYLHLSHKTLPNPKPLLRCHPHPFNPKSHSATPSNPITTQDFGIPLDEVKVLVQFKSRYHYIRVLHISRSADHPFAGSRLLLLDAPGNIHSLCFLFRSFTNTYYDAFSTLPPLLPPGPIGIFGFGAGSAARLMLELYPDCVLHGWELDPSVISVAREYFGLATLEKSHPDRLFVYIGNALQASVKDGFSGIVVDLFCNGCLIPELQDPDTWAKMKRSLRRGGRVMVNVGGSCVEPEDTRKHGKVLMEETLKVMDRVFPGQVSVLNLGDQQGESSIAVTGKLDIDAWRKSLPEPLKFYADMCTPFVQ